jgi:hypothetical protein
MRCGQRDVLRVVLRRTGVCRIYEMSIGNGEWKLWREGEPFSQRFTNYRTDFDLIYRRVAT